MHDQSRFDQAVRTEILLGADRQQFGQAGASPVDAALDGAKVSATDLCCFLIGDALGRDQQQGIGATLPSMSRTRPDRSSGGHAVAGRGKPIPRLNRKHLTESHELRVSGFMELKRMPEVNKEKAPV
jgi:hypothetical protein